MDHTIEISCLNGGKSIYFYALTAEHAYLYKQFTSNKSENNDRIWFTNQKGGQVPTYLRTAFAICSEAVDMASDECFEANSVTQIPIIDGDMAIDACSGHTVYSKQHTLGEATTTTEGYRFEKGRQKDKKEAPVTTNVDFEAVRNFAKEITAKLKTKFPKIFKK